MLTFFKWYQEWLIDCDYEPSQQQKEAMEDAWNGAMLTANEAAQQSVQSDGARVAAECRHGNYGACADCAIESLPPRR